MLKTASSPSRPRLSDVDNFVCDFQVFNRYFPYIFFPQKFSTFHQKNVENLYQTEFIFEVISLTVPLMVASVFRRSSTLRIDVRTVEWFLP